MQLHAPTRWRCGRCALPLPVAGTCADCAGDPPPFVRAQVAVDYGFPWSPLVARLKFGEALELAAPLAALMAGRIEPGDVTLLVPVPLSPGRLRERGFNQAERLARALGTSLDLPCDADLLQRPLERERQSGLSRDARLQNLRGVFMVDPARRGALDGRHVALVDDVMTTGATAREAAAELLRAGAGSVQLWAFARTP